MVSVKIIVYVLVIAPLGGMLLVYTTRVTIIDL